MTCIECEQIDPGSLTGCSLGSLVLEIRTVLAKEDDPGHYSASVKTERRRLQESGRGSLTQHHHKSPDIAVPQALVVDHPCRTNSAHVLAE